MGDPPTSNPTSTDIQAIISQLQEDKLFREIGRKWIKKLESEGLTVIEQLGNAVQRLAIEKDNILANLATLLAEKAKSEHYVSLLHMVIRIKVKEAVEAKILQKGDEPLFEWQQSLQFKAKMISAPGDGLQKTKVKIKEE